jgi:hypothetical protein
MYYGGYDLVWAIIRGIIILTWFIGVGLVSAFILHFKPTRRLLKKYLPFLFENVE